MTISARDKFNAVFLPYAARSLADWRARHPLKMRAVEPLPVWMHEKTVLSPLTSREARRQADNEAWDRLMGLY